MLDTHVTSKQPGDVLKYLQVVTLREKGRILSRMIVYSKQGKVFSPSTGIEGEFVAGSNPLVRRR